MTRGTARLTAVLAFATAIAGAAAVPALARADPSAAAVRSLVAAPGPAAVPHGLLPVAASWVSARRGLVLAYPSGTPGARPHLIETSDAGRAWKALPAPPLPYPADNDQPDLVQSGGVIAVTDGTRVQATGDGGRHWRTEKLKGASGSFFAGPLAVDHGRLLALVTTAGSAKVYAGTPGSGRLAPVPGLSVSGDEAYGDLSTAGGLEVDLGASPARQKYWYARDGRHFSRAPLPCPAAGPTFLGGVRQGKVVALCSDSPGAAGPGETGVRLRVAGHLGGAFADAGARVVIPDGQDFAAATAKAVSAAGAAGLAVTTDGGATWKPEVQQANGSSWSDLAFVSATTGFAVADTVNDQSQPAGTVYRTTSGGSTWSAVPLP
jgi:photosystem II stability/assembly factor-like uncharacterized protein